MTQKQRPIDVTYASGVTGDGIATGNNAAFHCDCTAHSLLVGFSDSDKSTDKSSLVVCPVCQRPYRVLAVYPRGRAMAVRAE